MLKRYITLMALTAAVFCSGSALAGEQKDFYTEEKIRGCEKGTFVQLTGDDVNFRKAPENGAVLRVLERHALLRVTGKEGDWYRADADGTEGYVYVPYTSSGVKDALTTEDFSLGCEVLNSRFDKQKAEESLGRELEVRKVKKLQMHRYELYTLGIGRRSRLVELIEVRDPGVITIRGISVGDSSARAVGQYGMPDSVSYREDETIYRYYISDKKNGYIRFSLLIDKNAKVAAMRLQKLK